MVPAGRTRRPLPAAARRRRDARDPAAGGPAEDGVARARCRRRSCCPRTAGSPRSSSRRRIPRSRWKRGCRRELEREVSGVGSGGWAGVISFPAMATALQEGYATASTDTGHKGGNALFAIGHPEKVVDFAYRAVHETTVQAEGAHRDVLRSRAAPVVLERLLDRRTAGSDGGAEVSRGLRRHHRRRAGELPDASARVGPQRRGAGAQGSGERGAGGEAGDVEQGGHRRVRRAATASRTAC